MRFVDGLSVFVPLALATRYLGPSETLRFFFSAIGIMPPEFFFVPKL